MAVVITDKAQMREIMKNEAKALVVRFCQLNGYAVPKLLVEKRSAHVCNFHTEGYYKDGGDVVAVVPGNTIFDNERSARYNVIDDTIYGAILHEVGHYIHEHYLNWETIPMGERSVSNYEPNNLEVFAETFRLYLSNPHLLSIWNPTRYAWMKARFKKVKKTNWKATFNGVNPACVARLEKIIATF